MDYVYIIVPVCFSLLIFSLTVGYLLLVKYKASCMLKSIRRDMIAMHCSPEFVIKPPDVTHGHALFTGIYREPTASVVTRGYADMQPLHELSENDASDSTLRVDANSDVIEVPLRPYAHHSSLSPEGMGGNYYGRSTHYDRHKSIAEEDSGRDGEGGGDTPLEYRGYQLVDEVGPANAYSFQKHQSKLPKLR
ncbi:hypothetical protein TcWFU_008457 [Taenia crassiceps]|uniref:Uncharacterized protein n=1 Tax=Taenia crassiceps TaxID=6207 RepID=A0ABR4Q0J8_9CEST